MTNADSPWPTGSPGPQPPPFSHSANTSGSSGDGPTVALSIVAIVGLIVAILTLWLTRCDVGAIDRLVESLPGAMIQAGS